MAFYTSLNPTVFKVFMEFLIVQSLLARLESAFSLNEGGGTESSVETFWLFYDN